MFNFFKRGIELILYDTNEVNSSKLLLKRDILSNAFCLYSANLLSGSNLTSLHLAAISLSKSWLLSKYLP